MKTITVLPNNEIKYVNTLFQNEGSFIYYDLDREQDMISLEHQLLSEVTLF